MGIFKLVKDFVESEDFELFTFQSGYIQVKIDILKRVALYVYLHSNLVIFKSSQSAEALKYMANLHSNLGIFKF